MIKKQFLGLSGSYTKFTTSFNEMVTEKNFFLENHCMKLYLEKNFFFF